MVRMMDSLNKILFTHSYFLRFDPKQWSTGQPYAPLGTLYAASLMRENKYEVSFQDSMFAETPADILPSFEKNRPDFFVIYDDGFNYLTKMCLTNMREAAFQMIKFAKQKGCTVIVSSSDSTDHFEQYLNEGADFILIGEAEITLLELVNAISQHQRDLLPIKGIAFKQNEAVIKTAPRNVMKDLDSLPFPAWDLIDMFRNTYQPAFYKQLHRYVHKSYRTHIALANIKQLIRTPAATSATSLKKALSLLYYAPASFWARQKLLRLERPLAV